jgi:hypothetical protein
MADDWQEYEAIYLQPWCKDCDRFGDERTWCHDNVWGKSGCEDCGRPCVRYKIDIPGKRGRQSNPASRVTTRKR